MPGSIRSRFAGMALLVAGMLALAAPAAAEQASANVHGTLDGGQFSCQGEPAATADISGQWNLNLSGSKATITMNVSYDGSHHTSFGWSGGVVTPTETGVVVRFGSSAVATLDGDLFTWTTPTSTSCDASGHDAILYAGIADR